MCQYIQKNTSCNFTTAETIQNHANKRERPSIIASVAHIAMTYLFHPCMYGKIIACMHVISCHDECRANSHLTEFMQMNLMQAVSIFHHATELCMLVSMKSCWSPFSFQLLGIGPLRGTIILSRNEWSDLYLISYESAWMTIYINCICMHAWLLLAHLLSQVVIWQDLNMPLNMHELFLSNLLTNKTQADSAASGIARSFQESIRNKLWNICMHDLMSCATLRSSEAMA